MSARKKEEFKKRVLARIWKSKRSGPVGVGGGEESTKGAGRRMYRRRRWKGLAGGGSRERGVDICRGEGRKVRRLARANKRGGRPGRRWWGWKETRAEKEEGSKGLGESKREIDGRKKDGTKGITMKRGE